MIRSKYYKLFEEIVFLSGQSLIKYFIVQNSNRFLLFRLKRMKLIARTKQLHLEQLI